MLISGYMLVRNATKTSSSLSRWIRPFYFLYSVLSIATHYFNRNNIDFIPYYPLYCQNNKFSTMNGIGLYICGFQNYCIYN